MNSSNESAVFSTEKSDEYFVGKGLVEAGSVVNHRNVSVWRDEKTGEWHAEALPAPIQEVSWSKTALTSTAKTAVIWRGNDVVISASPNLNERLTIERAVDANRKHS